MFLINIADIVFIDAQQGEKLNNFINSLISTTGHTVEIAPTSKLIR
jgi:hypothetical protein